MEVVICYSWKFQSIQGTYVFKNFRRFAYFVLFLADKKAMQNNFVLYMLSTLQHI